MEEPNVVQGRSFQLIEVQQTKELFGEKIQEHQNKVKVIFDKWDMEINFLHGDLGLRWDATSEDKGKHGKFVWFGPFTIEHIIDNNTFILQNLNGENLLGGPMIGCFLKQSFIY